MSSISSGNLLPPGELSSLPKVQQSPYLLMSISLLGLCALAEVANTLSLAELWWAGLQRGTAEYEEKKQERRQGTVASGGEMHPRHP